APSPAPAAGAGARLGADPTRKRVTSTGRVEGDATLRLFLALRLPGAVLDELERWCEEGLRPTSHAGLRRGARGHLPIPLAFLGARPAGDMPAIVDALREAASRADAFDLEATGYRETRSVGMIVMRDPFGGAGRLAGELQRSLEVLGVYRREAREWLPH